MRTSASALIPVFAFTQLLALGVSSGCTSEKVHDSDSADQDTAGDAVCVDATTPACVDEMILDLSMHDDKTSDGEVVTTTDGTDFVTEVDASGGGYNTYENQPWVYIKFGPTGATRVDIDDETSLESMDWDLSLRRFILRMNGGDSGPSCVGAAVLGQGYTYEDLTEVPDGISYQTDDYYTDDCTIVNDSSGLENSPQVVLGPWWDYPGCVATTGQPFLMQLADGSVIKLRVDAYYGGDGQDQCNSTGSTTEAGGFFKLRWAFMPE